MKKILLWLITIGICPVIALAVDTYTYRFVDIDNVSTGTTASAQTSALLSGPINEVWFDVQSGLTCSVTLVTVTNNTDWSQITLLSVSDLASDAIYRPRFPVHTYDGIQIAGATNEYVPFCLSGEYIQIRAYSANVTNKTLRCKVKIGED